MSNGKWENRHGGGAKNERTERGIETYHRKKKHIEKRTLVLDSRYQQKTPDIYGKNRQITTRSPTAT